MLEAVALRVMLYCMQKADIFRAINSGGQDYSRTLIVQNCLFSQSNAYNFRLTFIARLCITFLLSYLIFSFYFYVTLIVFTAHFCGDKQITHSQIIFSIEILIYFIEIQLLCY
jgi:ABC-type Na+ efflux pump permease subunit